jgi:hypothetical protein
VSSTDDEKAVARVMVLAIRDFLTAQGWPQPIFADSGNGYHLAGISPATASKYELGTAEPTSHMWAKIQAVLATLGSTVPALKGEPRIVLSPARRGPFDRKPTTRPQTRKGE